MSTKTKQKTAIVSIGDQKLTLQHSDDSFGYAGGEDVLWWRDGSML